MNCNNKVLVGRYYDEVLTKREFNVIDEIFDVTFQSHLSNGTSIGLEVYKSYIKESFAALSDIEVHIKDQISEQNKVVTRWVAKGKLVKPFAGISEIGKTVEVSAIHIHRIKNGLIVDHWEAINLHAIMIK